jgi:hypothetical protein
MHVTPRALIGWLRRRLPSPAICRAVRAFFERTKEVRGELQLLRGTQGGRRAEVVDRM